MDKMKNISMIAEQYYDKYRDYVDLYEKKSVKSQIEGKIREEDVYALGKQLEQTEGYIKFVEANGSKGDLGVLPNIALDVVVASAAQSPIPLMASIQPIEEEKGTIYYKAVEAGSTRGNVNKGDILQDSINGRKKVESGFAGEHIIGEVEATGDGTATTFNFTVKYAPILKRTLTVYVAGTNVKLVDDGQGNLIGIGGQGTVNYETGSVTVSFTNAPAKDAEIVADYDSNFEAMTEIPTVRTTFESLSVQARVYALRTEIGLFKSYSMSKRFGMNVEEVLAQDLTQELTTEVSANVVSTAYLNAVGETHWDKKTPSGISYTEHKLTFFDAIANAESEILKNAGRLNGAPVLIVGNKVAAIIRTLPGFKPAPNVNAVLGTHFYGTLEGKVVIRSIVLPENEALLVAKGSTMFDAGLVYAPYLPLFVTDTYHGMDHNPLNGQKAVALEAAIAAPVKTLITKLVVDNA